ncbi:uncharacterized protein [Halyomorpha halys]|uniref:uncharacterized protein n=1 Tax=Halyomorpha halys TaxID=286706 RepID=UPI0006D4D3FA|nr:uncharacterized protein LOC106681238 [Halyomorpha halys]
MTYLEDFYRNELEFDFYGFTAPEVIDEVKGCIEDLVDAAVEDSKKKLSNKFGSCNDKEFAEVEKYYLEAIENHKMEMEELIKDSLKLPYLTEILTNESKSDISNLEQEIKDLQLRSAALDIYMKELIKAEVEIQVFADTDISELQNNFKEIDISVSQLSDNFHLANDLFSEAIQQSHLEQSFDNMSIK